MNLNTILKVTIIDSFEEAHEIYFKRYDYPNLMELIIDNYYEEIGDCGGRGLCGTCHVKSDLSIVNHVLEEVEVQTLSKLDSSVTSRLACQIMVDEKINKRSFKIISDN